VSSLKGPLGAASAAIAGVAALAFQQAREEAEKVAEFVDSIAGAVDEQFDLLEGRMDAVAQKQQFAAWLDEQKETIAGWADNADLAGVKIEEFALAVYSGGKDAEAIREALEGAVEEGTRLVGEANPTPVMDDAAIAAQKLLDIMGDTESEVAEVARQERIAVAALDAWNARAGEASQSVQRIQDRWDVLRRNIEATEINVTGRINWYNTGPGKAYVDPGGANYSPGHVAIQGHYTQLNRSR
jgi:hypothetical protein